MSVLAVFSLALGIAESGRWARVPREPSPPDVPCYPRVLAGGARLCVCNVSHCDALGPIPPFPSRMFNVYRSDSRGSRFAFSKKNLVAGGNGGGGGRMNPTTVKIIVNSSEVYQKVLGFGGTLSDAAAINMHSLSEGARHRLLASYFSIVGIGYTLVRVSIGGSDFSNRTHTLDDESGDATLAHFSLSTEDLAFKIPDLRTANNLSERGVGILATAWTAPPWMKTNGDYKGFGVLKDEYYSLWSKYHLRFLEEYDRRGVKVWAVSTGHQPSAGLVPFYPYSCMGWTPFSQSRWISENLGPDLRASKFNSTKILILDDSRFFLPWWPRLMFDGQKTKSFVSGIGVQWYWNFLFPPRLLDLTHDEFPDKFILSTEAAFNKWWGSMSEPIALGSWTRAEEYAENMIDDFNHWTSGWLDSNLALDLRGGPNWAGNFADAPVIVNSSADEFYKQPLFYAMGHFSKFVPVGSFRIGVKVSRAAIKAAAFRTPRGNVAVVLLNKKSHDVRVTVVGAKRGDANVTLKKKSITTIIYRDKKQ